MPQVALADATAQCPVRATREMFNLFVFPPRFCRFSRAPISCGNKREAKSIHHFVGSKTDTPTWRLKQGVHSRGSSSSRYLPTGRVGYHHGYNWGNLNIREIAYSLSGLNCKKALDVFHKCRAHAACRVTRLATDPENSSFWRDPEQATPGKWPGLRSAPSSLFPPETT